MGDRQSPLGTEPAGVCREAEDAQGMSNGCTSMSDIQTEVAGNRKLRQRVLTAHHPPSGEFGIQLCRLQGWGEGGQHNLRDMPLPGNDRKG